MHTTERRNLKNAVLSLVILLSLPVQSSYAQSVQRRKAQIIVGSNVQVSKGFEHLLHGENLAAGDPEHPGRLITCSMVAPKPLETSKRMVVQCYVSFNAGKSWVPTNKMVGGNFGDPTVVYGNGNDVYALALFKTDVDLPWNTDPDVKFSKASRMLLYKSTDGGRTWAEPSQVAYTDRPYIVIDRTHGVYDGRLYIVGQTGFKGTDGSEHTILSLSRSLDGGKTFLGPIYAHYPEGMWMAGVNNCVVLSDGTFVAMFGMSKKGFDELRRKSAPDCELHVISSKTGGETFTRSVKIADYRLGKSEGGRMGQLAADPGSNSFKDRLYAVWPALVSDRTQILSSYSFDKGNTWSKPMIVNDDRSPEEHGRGPDHLLPSVAVNKDGVVLVTWYDRREAKDNLGWKVRGATSLDGGETFSASVPIADAPNSYPEDTPWVLDQRSVGDVLTGDKASLISLSVNVNWTFFNGGHTSGLAVDADGVFHPTWIDNRTGVAQLWSAPVRIIGSVVKHGADELADLEDISSFVTLRLSKPAFDRRTDTITMTAQLQNFSKDTVVGPVKVRVLTLESEFGIPEIVNADNDQSGTGAVWDLTAQLLEGELSPMAVSAPKTLTLRLRDLRTLGQGLESNLVDVDVRVLGKLRKNSTGQ
jgi:hypothetical protein